MNTRERKEEGKSLEKSQEKQHERGPTPNDSLLYDNSAAVHSDNSASLLSDKGILRLMKENDIVIHPFVPMNLSTSSYDVTLGEYYFQEQYKNNSKEKIPIYNPYAKRDVNRVWGVPQKAVVAEQSGCWPLENIRKDEQIILIGPGETILAHTNEFIGGRNTVTTMMKARSSLGRNFIEVCKCAGWGDIGYVNRWTMEITNNSRFYTIPLVVGRRIAQIVFFDTEGTYEGRSYERDGKYQTSEDVEKLIQEWTPYSCLPQMYNDRECKLN